MAVWRPHSQVPLPSRRTWGNRHIYIEEGLEPTLENESEKDCLPLLTITVTAQEIHPSTLRVVSTWVARVERRDRVRQV